MRDTGLLTLAEHGAYALMLDIHYSTEAPLPAGKDLYKLLRCDSPTERKAVDSIVKKFFFEVEGGICNKRVLKEVERAELIRERNKRNGEKGGRPNAAN